MPPLSHRSLLLLVPALLAPATAQRTLRVHPGDFSNEQYGRVTAALGDVDRDGVADYAIAVHANNSNPRTTTLVDVRSGRDGSLLHRLTGTETDRFGESVAGIPDVDGDGHDDVLVGAPLTPSASGQSGEVRLYSGRTGARLRTYFPQGSPPGVARFGTGIATLDDVDGDGVHDFVCTVPGQSVVQLISGRTGAQLHEAVGSRNSSGAPVAALGDLDGDGLRDYVTAEPRSTKNGAVWVRSGADGRTLFGYTATDDELLGASLSGVADVDGDGTPDFALGAPLEPAPGTGERVGAVHVYSGSTGRRLYTTFAPGLDAQRFGVSLTQVDDLNGDGIGEIAVGAGSGTSLWILSGATGQVLAEMLNGRVGSGGLSALQDLDGDGIGELLVGAPFFTSNAENQGAGIVLSPRLLARVVRMPTQCGAGPWLPEIGSTRPRLGTQVMLNGRDAPAGTVGILFLAAGHPAPFDFGYDGCDVFVDVGTAVQIPLPPMDRWSLPVTIPDLPQLAGIRFALQSAYGPTGGRLGFDLSNALHWFLGE